MRGDFIGAENSTGFHSPREASRILLQAMDMIRTGQAKLMGVALKYGFKDIQKLNPGDIKYKVNTNDARQATGKNHKAGDRYYEHSNINDAPSQKLLDLDKANKPYDHKAIDPKVDL